MVTLLARWSRIVPSFDIPILRTGYVFNALHTCYNVEWTIDGIYCCGKLLMFQFKGSEGQKYLIEEHALVE